MRATGAAIGAVGVALLPGSPSAQPASPFGGGDLRSGRNMTVIERPRPGYEAAGGRLGPVFVYPRLEAEFELDDNIHADETDKGDAIWRLRPEVRFEADRGDAHVAVHMRGAIHRHARAAVEDTESLGLGGSGRIAPARNWGLAFGLEYAKDAEPRTSPDAPGEARSPVSFDLAQAVLGGDHRRGRLSLSGRGDWRSYDYSDGVSRDGVAIDQDHRDHRTTRLSGQAAYAFSPDWRVFVEMAGDRREYPRGATVQAPRDSSGMEVVAGATFEIGGLVRGEVAAGRLRQDYKAPDYRDLSGHSARVRAEWLLSGLTTVTVDAARKVEDAGRLGVGGYLSSGTRLRLDHELLRRLILSAQLVYGQDQYDDIDRTDRRQGVVLAAAYLVNRNLRIRLSLAATDVRSSGRDSGVAYRVNRMALALASQF